MNFTIFYFKPERVKSFDDLFNKEKVTEANGFEELVPSNQTADLDFIARAYLQSNKTKQPPWVSFINPYFRIDEIKNVTNSLILLIEITAYRKKHFFAIVGGLGHVYLNKSRLQNDF